MRLRLFGAVEAGVVNAVVGVNIALPRRCNGVSNGIEEWIIPRVGVTNSAPELGV